MLVFLVIVGSIYLLGVLAFFLIYQSWIGFVTLVTVLGCFNRSLYWPLDLAEQMSRGNP